MKNILKYFKFMVPLVLVGCGVGNSQQKVNKINSVIEIENCEIKEGLFLENNNNRFVWSRIASADRLCDFYFILYDGSGTITLSNEFTYTNSSNEILELKTDINYGYDVYTFSGSFTIYIYFSDIIDIVKPIIDSNNYSITCASRSWYPTNTNE